MYLSSVESKVENKIAGCLPDSQRITATTNLNDRYKEKRKGAGIRSKYNT